MADFLKWKDEWNTAIPDIDRQHLEISNQLNKIIEEVSRTDASGIPASIEKLLDDLLDMARQHFKYEELLMLQSNYLDYPNHVKEHVMLIAELVVHIRDIKKQMLQLDAISLKALKNWFVAHIVISDKAFAKYYISSKPV